jgi:7,8-dihydropterin-6-yl-methyl-4-(beta-D-ribofuranosyl)aminobenzene 5'-phosphate synthase
MEGTVNSHSRVISHSVVALLLLTCTAKLFAAPQASAIPGTMQITVLYDAFGRTPGMQKDWGYSALIEYAGKRILFDTGNNPEILEQNAKAKGADLSKLDFVVMSHRHGDHMGGLPYLLKVNPAVKIYAPKESFGVYGADLLSSLYRKDPSLPLEQRYYDGNPPEIMRFGSAWPAANFKLVDKNTEIAPNIHLITLVSDKPGTLELRELSPAINTPEGIVIIVGCSHPGVDKVVATAATINPHIHLIAGGFHLVVTSDSDIEKIVMTLHDTLQSRVRRSGSLHGRARICGVKKIFRGSLSVRGAGNST